DTGPLTSASAACVDGRLLLRRSKVPQIRGRLVLAAGVELAVDADHVAFALDENPVVVLATAMLGPHGLRRALVAARHGPRLGEGMVDDRDLVAQHIWV